MQHGIIGGFLACALVPCALAYTVTSDDINNYSGKWAYVWDNNVATGLYQPADKNSSNWQYVSSTTQESPQSVSNSSGAGAYPSTSSNDIVLIGYDYIGGGAFTSNDTQITVKFGSGEVPYDVNSDHITKGTIYLGKNATFAIQTMYTYSESAMSFHYGDLGTTNARVTAGAIWTGYDTDGSSVFSFSGTLDMSTAAAGRITDHTFSYLLFDGTSDSGNLNATDKVDNFPSWTAAGMRVTDEFGNTLTYTEDESLKNTEGYFYLDVVPEGTASKITATLVANGYSSVVPEPATSTLGLLALGMLVMKRRRRTA